MTDRKYLAISIKHSAGTRFTLWGWERTKDEQKRCFSGYLGTMDYDKCELIDPGTGHLCQFILPAQPAGGCLYGPLPGNIRGAGLPLDGK